jgi:hypothetical protein
VRSRPSARGKALFSSRSIAACPLSIAELDSKGGSMDAVL